MSENDVPVVGGGSVLYVSSEYLEDLCERARQATILYQKVQAYNAAADKFIHKCEHKEAFSTVTYRELKAARALPESGE